MIALFLFFMASISQADDGLTVINNYTIQANQLTNDQVLANLKQGMTLQNGCTIKINQVFNKQGQVFNFPQFYCPWTTGYWE